MGSPVTLDCCCCSVAQLCLILCNPMDSSPPGSSPFMRFSRQVLEWDAVSFPRGSFRPRDWTHISSTVKWILYCWAMRKLPVSPDKRSQIHKVTVKTGRGESRGHFQIPLLIWIHVVLKDTALIWNTEYFFTNYVRVWQPNSKAV